MIRGLQGRLVQQSTASEGFEAFVPFALPPNPSRIGAMGQAAGNVSRFHSYLQKKPVLEIPRASREIEISQPTVTSALKKLEEIGIVREITGKASPPSAVLGVLSFNSSMLQKF